MQNENKPEKDLKKEKIRKRYQGVPEEELVVIPAIPQTDIYDEQTEQNVAVYVRVSTEDPRQTSSYELQKNHYQDVVNKHPDWKLVGIYADEGISGTSLQHREAFLQMIRDCHDGKINLIITKSVSRFARNLLDCIGYVRELASLEPPVGIFFETENIYTLKKNSELSLSIIATLAQEESHNKSEIMNASIEMRFKRGIFLTPPLLGYDQNENGELIINEEEAKTVRFIYFMYLSGHTCQAIAQALTNLGRKTKPGNTTWSASSVLQQLQNERHCGDVRARKTFTPNYLDHKSKKNKQNRQQYLKIDHHEAIISRSDFMAVQRLILSAKYGNKDFMPCLHVITDGLLKGFVSVHPKWAAFKAEDYQAAFKNVLAEDMQPVPDLIHAESGTFDLRGYEVASAQFFNITNQIRVTFSIDAVTFSTECIRRFETNYVELLVHPEAFYLAVRPTKKDDKNSMQWSKRNNDLNIPRQINGAAFLPALFHLFGWNSNCKYRILGTIKQHAEESIILFNLKEAEVFIPDNALQNAENAEEENSSPLLFENNMEPLGTKHGILAYPEDWSYRFGNDFYYQAQALEFANLSKKDWNMQARVSYDPEPPLQVTTMEEIQDTLKTMMADMKQEAENGK